MLKKLLSFSLIIFIFAGCQQQARELNRSIVPDPVNLTPLEGAFEIDQSTGLFFSEGLETTRGVIKDYLMSITSLNLSLSEDSVTNALVFKIDQRDSLEYKIESSGKRVVVSAGSKQALLYGFQSLRQLLLLNDNKTIPSLEIIDSPRFQWRGLLLDCSRHFMEKEFVKRYIDLLALYKMNVLHWHLTEDQGWRIAIDKYPKLTSIGAWRDDGNGGKYGGFYTKEDITEIVTYAEERGVTIVPEIELPGHSQAALAAYPQFSCTGGPFEVETEWGVFKEIYCAGNDSTFVFLEDVLTEVITLFPSEYIHIGGDEVPKYRWENCSKCQKRIADEGLHDEHELQSYFIGRIGRFLASKGKKMIGWDEILEGGLPEGATVQSWRGYEGAIQAVKQGNKAILSPTSHSYFDYGLNDIDMEKVYSFDPIPAGLSDNERQMILGGECNMWSERAPQSKVDIKVFPRILAMAEVLWSYPSDRNFELFKQRARENYQVLEKMEVNYGFETVPVKVSTQLNDGLEAILTPYDSTINVYFEVGENNEHYKNSVAINQPTTWAITFGRGETMFKDTIYQSFDPHLANRLSYSLASQPNKNYVAGGEKSLTDGLKGSSHFRDGNWQGFWGEDVMLTLDLGEITKLTELSAGFLQYNNAWIFFPEWVKFEGSVDGNSFMELGVVNNVASPKDKEQTTQQFRLNLQPGIEVRYLRMSAKNMGVCPDWHDAAGSPSWLFVDEISIK